jgi:hypothetical protein
VVEGVFGEMIFEEDIFTGDAGGFAEEHGYVGGVMEDVDEEAEVDGVFWERERAAVEGFAGDLAIRAGEEFDALDAEVGALLKD